MAKVLFIQDLAYEYFGAMHISAVLKARGHECHVLIENMERDLIGSALAVRPDLIAFSCLTPTVQWALKVARQLKQKCSVPIIFGGSHITLNPEGAFQYPEVDYVCVGEGEFPTAELCDCLDQGKSPDAILNLWGKYHGDHFRNPLRRLIEDLDSLPYADRELYAHYVFFSLRKVKTIMIGRGCPYQCNYCHNHAKMKLFQGLGRYVNIRSPNHVLGEIDALTARYDVNCLHFIDDAFGAHKKWLREALPQIAERGIRFIGAVRANHLDDEMCALMKKSGLDYVSFAVETGDEKFRNSFLKKDILDEQLFRAARVLRVHKIPYLTMNMVALPDEKLHQTFLTLKLNMLLKPVYACCYIYQPYPNTELYNYLIDTDQLDPDFINKMGFLSYDTTLLHHSDIKTQKNIQRLFALTVMFPKLFGIVKRLVRMPPNIVFDGIFYLLYAYYLKRYFRLTFRMIAYNIRFWLTFKFLAKSKVEQPLKP